MEKSDKRKKLKMSKKIWDKPNLTKDGKVVRDVIDLEYKEYSEPADDELPETPKH